MKKIAVIFLIIGLLVVGAYVFVRSSLKTPHFDPPIPQKAEAATTTSESILDLRPKLVEKLQQLVKLGSNGLYDLFIHDVNPDILKSTVGISKASLIPDTVVMKELEQSKNLPDQIFKIEADSVWIEGFGAKDILSKDVIDVKTIHILRPTIDIYSKKRAYNQNQETKTLYQRLMNQMKHIGIGNVVIENGTLVHHNLEKNTSTKFNDIAIHLTNVVVDSTTQFDKNRFLFARDAELTLKNYSVPTSNNLYTFKIGTISIAATKQLLVAKNVELEPHYNKNEFQKHIKIMTERYQISIPSIEFRKTNWWSLINDEVLQAQFAQIDKANVSVYLDRRTPSGPTDIRGFPHQLIMKLPLKINIANLKVNDLDLVYEEFSKLSGKPGKLYVDNMHGTISNLTNLPQLIKRNKITTVKATGTFMHVSPADLTLYFDLSNYKTGAFSAELKSNEGFDGTIVNSIAEPLGLFMVKRGNLKKLIAHVSGDNFKASGDVLMLYDNLHVTPLKKDEDKPGGLKKKSVTSLIANTFVLKDENPSKGAEERKVDASFTRKDGTFFNLLWKTIFVGILKTIGAPEKLAYE